MPNYCQNELQIFGSTEDLQRFKTAAVGRNTWPAAEPRTEDELSVLSFHTLDPIPAEVLASDYHCVGYPWEQEHWGCRWGACDAVLVDEGDESLSYHFDTPWSPPVPFLTRLGPRWPTLTFVLAYEELGDGFKGLCKVKGDHAEDHRINLG